MVRRGVGEREGIILKIFLILSKLLLIYLDVLNTEIQDTVVNKPVFDPDFQKRKVGIHFNKCDFVAARVVSLKKHVEN